MARRNNRLTDSNEGKPNSKVALVPIEQLFVPQEGINWEMETDAEELVEWILQRGIQGIRRVQFHVYRVGDRFSLSEHQWTTFLAVRKIRQEHPEHREALGLLHCIVHEQPVRVVYYKKEARNGEDPEPTLNPVLGRTTPLMHIPQSYGNNRLGDSDEDKPSPNAPASMEQQAIESRINLILNRKTDLLDKARAVRELIGHFGSLAEASRQSGIPKATLSQLDSLNDLDPRVLEMVFNSGTSFKVHLNESVLIELTKLSTERQVEIAQKIISEGLTTEQARSLVRAERYISAPSSDAMVSVRVHVLTEIYSALESVSKKNHTTVDNVVEALLGLILRKYGYLSSGIQIMAGDQPLTRIEQILGKRRRAHKTGK